MEPIEVDPQHHSLDSFYSFALELIGNEVGRREGGIDQMAQSSDVAPGQCARGPANRSSG